MKKAAPERLRLHPSSFSPHPFSVVGIVATRSFGRFQGGSRRPDEEPLVFCFRCVRQLRRTRVSRRRVPAKICFIS